MLVDREEYYDAYKAIQADGASCPVVVLVSAADCDSCAAFRTLRALFKADAVPFSAYPVAGYEEVQRHASTLAGCGAAERMLVLINCGGTENLHELLGLDRAPGTRVVVVDSHRPLHLHNTAAGNEAVLVLRDSRERAPGTRAESFPEPPSESEADGDSDAEDCSLHENGGDRSVRQRTEGDGAAVTSKTVERAQRRSRAHSYYTRGSFYGRSSACVLYDLAHSCRKEAIEHHSPLWMAVVGLTDHYLHGRTSAEQYSQEVVELAQRVADCPGGEASLGEGGTVAAFAQRRLAYSSEFRFMLLRHWSLYEAMVHAPYTAVRLQTWTEPGRRALDRLLAETGLPLAECRQQFRHMSTQATSALQGRLGSVAVAYGLGELSFWSFTRQHGAKLNVCASDAVFAVTALLEMPPVAGDTTGGQGAFERALSALGDGHFQLLRQGIQHAQRLQRALVRTGGAALAGGCVVNAGAFRVVNLAQGGAAGGADAALLHHPMALLKLALFLQDAMLVQKPRGCKPLVLAAPDAGSGTGDVDAAMVLIIGINSAPKLSDTHGNRFALSFRQAAEAVRAPFVHDCFEAAVVRLAASHLGPFLEQLQSEMEDLAANAG